jgi:hypothetical protein
MTLVSPAGETADVAEVGERVIDVPIMCAITRFGLRSPRLLISTLRDYQRVLGNVRDPESFGFLKSAFLIENPTTCYTFSIWSAFPMFSPNVAGHIEAARRVFGRLSYEPERGPELWSTKWRLVSVTNNLNWDGFDLREVIKQKAAA